MLSIKKEKSKNQNIAFHNLVKVRVEAMGKINEEEKAKDELSYLAKLLSSRGVNKSVLQEIKTNIETIEEKQKK